MEAGFDRVSPSRKYLTGHLSLVPRALGHDVHWVLYSPLFEFSKVYTTSKAKTPCSYLTLVLVIFWMSFFVWRHTHWFYCRVHSHRTLFQCDYHLCWPRFSDPRSIPESMAVNLASLHIEIGATEILRKETCWRRDLTTSAFSLWGSSAQSPMAILCIIHPVLTAYPHKATVIPSSFRWWILAIVLGSEAETQTLTQIIMSWQTSTWLENFAFSSDWIIALSISSRLAISRYFFYNTACTLEFRHLTTDFGTFALVTFLWSRIKRAAFDIHWGQGHIMIFVSTSIKGK